MVYDWKKTLEKFGWSAAFVVVAGLIAYSAENPAWLILVPLLEAAKNYIKHNLIVIKGGSA